MVSAEEYEAWEVTFRAAKTAMVDREDALDAAAELIEKDLLLLGATAIEDKLQAVRHRRKTARKAVSCDISDGHQPFN